MKPKFPLTQPFEELPETLPIYLLDNGLLPGGELPLTISEAHELSMFIDILRSDQLIGIIQPCHTNSEKDIYSIGCAGRIRQYRERKDGKINLMITGICRFKVVEEINEPRGYRKVHADWSEYAHDYEASTIESGKITQFKDHLRLFFQSHQMQVDWNTLDRLEPEELISNLLLVSNFSTALKQQLVESHSLETRLELFTSLLEEKAPPIWVNETQNQVVN